MRRHDPTGRIEPASLNVDEGNADTKPEPAAGPRGWVLAAAVGVTVLVFGYLFTLSGGSPSSEQPAAVPPPMASETVSTTYSPPTTTTTLFVPTDGLVAHLPLDGLAVDRSGVRGAQPTRDRFGRSNGAYLFDGDSDHISTTVSTPRLAGPVTLAAWVRLDAAERDVAAWWSVVSLGEGGFVLALDGDGAPVGGLHDERCRFSGSTEVPDGRWHHVAVTRDAVGTIRVFLDGAGQLLTSEIPGRGGTQMAAIVQPCSTVPELGDGTFWVGGAPGIGQHFEGAIDDVRIYDRAVPAAGIRELFAE